MSVEALAVRRRHRWQSDDDPRPVRDESSGIERRKRFCVHCKMTRITVIPPHGHAWHEWITADGQSWQGEATPPCVEGAAP